MKRGPSANGPYSSFVPAKRINDGKCVVETADKIGTSFSWNRDGPAGIYDSEQEDPPLEIIKQIIT